MEAIVVTDRAAGMAGMMLTERPEPRAAINDVVVQVHASGFVPTELAWPSTGIVMAPWRSMWPSRHATSRPLPGEVEFTSSAATSESGP